jgi:hypothetical protein
MKIIYTAIFVIFIIGCQSSKKLSILKKNSYLKEVSIKDYNKYYTINQPIEFEIDTRGERGYLYIFHINNQKSINLIYPNRYSPLSELQGEYLFPRDFGNMKIFATKDCQKCKEERTNIYAFLSKEPISDIEKVTSDELLNLFEKKPTCKGFSMIREDRENRGFNRGKLEFIVKGNSIIGNLSSSKNRSIQSKAISKNKIIGHCHKSISSIREAQELKNTFTYILFPRDLKGERKDTKKYKRYTKVLELVQELKRIDNINSSNISIKDENKFILMKTDPKDKEKITVEKYNYVLSHKIIDFFKYKTPTSFFDKEGPFFITVTKNIFNQKDNFSFLYLDLSTFNESAIIQVIESYKKRLVKKGDKNIDTLEEWHYQLLSAITNFNDNFHLFNVVYAGVSK